MGDSAAPVLIVGSDSLIGGTLRAHLRQIGWCVLGTTRRTEKVDSDCLHLDLLENAAEWRCPQPVSAAVICAGVTKLETCRRDPEATARVNVQGITAVVDRLREVGAFVIYLSTNLVFDGSVAHRRADDETNPTTEYGKQKAAVEKVVLGTHPTGAVVRLTKVLEPNTPLLTGWRESLRRGEAIQPFVDLVMAPVPLTFVVTVLQRLLERKLPGVFQVSGEQDVTYAEVAYHLARRLGASADLIHPITTAVKGIPPEAARRHTTLDTTRLKSELGLMPPRVWPVIDDILGL